MPEAAAPESSMDPNRQNPYGPGANADETRQAQHMAANDTPVDVNLNAITARSQALTVDVLGKAWTANQDRREKIADHAMGKQISS